MSWLIFFFSFLYPLLFCKSYQGNMASLYEPEFCYMLSVRPAHSVVTELCCGVRARCKEQPVPHTASDAQEG